MKGEVGGASSAAILGLKVGGGNITESGKVGALVEKVKKGSIADTVGHLRPGENSPVLQPLSSISVCLSNCLATCKN